MNTNCPILKPPNQSLYNPMSQEGKRPSKEETLRGVWGMQEWNGLLLYWGLISHGNPSRDAEPHRDACMEGLDTYSGKAAIAQSADREWEALWTFWLWPDPCSLSVFPKPLSYTPVSADGLGHYGFISLFVTKSSLPPSSNLGCMVKCWALFSWTLVCVQMGGVMAGAYMCSFVPAFGGFPTCAWTSQHVPRYKLRSSWLLCSLY